MNQQLCSILCPEYGKGLENRISDLSNFLEKINPSQLLYSRSLHAFAVFAEAQKLYSNRFFERELIIYCFRCRHFQIKSFASFAS